MINLVRLAFIFILCKICYVKSGAIQITNNNIDSILSSNELVFINFYANWCRFSQILSPIYDQLADKIEREYSNRKNLIVIGKVDCDADQSITLKYHVTKYPTLKLFRNGIVTKREYRGARQVDAFFEFLNKQIETSIKNISNENEILKTKSNIIGYFNDLNTLNYQIFMKVANLLREDCQFNLLIKKNEDNQNDFVYFRSINDEISNYTGLLINEESFYIWSNNKCIPFIKEITFENAEELTDEGLPFLILFHHQDDKQSISIFEKEISKQIIHYKSYFNCLHGDGSKFIHPLKHLGKTLDDLPLLIIDSFKHMFLFPDFKQISENGKLLQFIKDFQSEKLHRDFHNKNEVKSKSVPPKSVFVNLKPNQHRYSFRDEL